MQARVFSPSMPRALLIRTFASCATDTEGHHLKLLTVFRAFELYLLKVRHGLVLHGSVISNCKYKVTLARDCRNVTDIIRVRELNHRGAKIGQFSVRISRIQVRPVFGGDSSRAAVQQIAESYPQVMMQRIRNAYGEAKAQQSLRETERP